MPFGYYHPQDSDLYYLQSRYYDPNTCRFLNADGLASTGQGFVGCNMFAYCNNNPAAYYDDGGTKPKSYDDTVDDIDNGDVFIWTGDDCTSFSPKDNVSSTMPLVDSFSGQDTTRIPKEAYDRYFGLFRKTQLFATLRLQRWKAI